MLSILPLKTGNRSRPQMSLLKTGKTERQTAFCIASLMEKILKIYYCFYRFLPD